MFRLPNPRDFLRQGHTRGRGRAGEDSAARWLASQGFEILARNVVNKGGEIDFVATENGTLCFVEVKARSTPTFGPALAAVPRTKQRRIARAAAFYLTRHPPTGPCRFDVLAMDLVDEKWQFQLVRDAFQVPSGSFGP